MAKRISLFCITCVAYGKYVVSHSIFFLHFNINLNIKQEAHGPQRSPEQQCLMMKKLD